MEITLDTAKVVVETAIKYGAWDWDDPKAVTDDLVVSTAVKLATQVQELSKVGNVNEGVLDILRAAGVEPLSDQTREAYLQRFGADSLSGGASPTQAPADSSAFAGGNSHEEPPATEPASAGAFSAQPQMSETTVVSATPAGFFDINSVYPGYDEQKVADIKKAVLHFASTGELTPEEWEQIKAYEAANEERKTILSLQPEFPAPEPEPAASTFEQRTEQEGVTITPRADGATEFRVPTGHADHQQSATEFFAGGAREEGGDSVQAFYNGETISRAAQEALPIPASPQADPAALVMPIDITTTSDQDLSRLATTYHSLFARTQWLISQEEGRERAAEQLEHDAHRDAYNQAYENHKSAIPEGKSGPTALDSARKLAEKDADGAQPVHVWRTRKIRHAIDARELKALSTGYDKAVFRINDELERRTRLATSGHVAK